MKAVLLSVAMAGVMTSCQKDEFQSEMVVPSHEMSQKVLAHQELTLRYWIDGEDNDDTIGTRDVYFWDPLIKEYSIGRFSWTMEGSNNN